MDWLAVLAVGGSIVGGAVGKDVIVRLYQLWARRKDRSSKTRKEDVEFISDAYRKQIDALMAKVDRLEAALESTKESHRKIERRNILLQARLKDERGVK